MTDPGAAHSKRGLILAACMMATFTAAVEGTIVATAMPVIAAELHGGDLYTWVFSAFLLTQAAAIPIYGRLADLYGRKVIFALGAGVFLLGSILCGCAGGMGTLIAFRAIQGCGAGAVQPIASTIVGDIYTPAERARVQGLLSAVFGAAAIGGPVIGSFLLHAGSWRFVFWINIPIVIAAITMICVLLPAADTRKPRRIDYWGALLLVTGIAALFLAADRWRQIGGANVLIAGTTGLAALLLLARHEARTPEPMLPAVLWRNTLIAACALGAFTTGVAIISVAAFVPYFVQAAMRHTAAEAGGIIGLMMLTWLAGSFWSGRLMVKIPYRTTGIAGALAIMAGAVPLVLLAPDSPLAQVAAGIAVFSLGLGFCNTTWIVAAQTRVAYDQRASATAAIMFMRFFGQALGAAMGGVILSFTLAAALPEIADPMGRLLDIRMGAAAAGASEAGLAAAVEHGIHQVFIMTGVMGLATLILASRLPPGVNASTPKP